ncbi:MAG: sugar transferase [Solirubrobacterales bacterium]|nr:sugar transferase [Solirubrobacterales bacterium]
MGISVRANTQAAAATNGHEAPEGVDLARVPVWDDPAHGHVVGVKRALDIVLSLLLLVFLAPLLLIIAAMIKADSPGPVLFRQTRVGRWGKPFSMLKFRTMFQGADEKKPELLHLNESEGLFKITGDPRITRFGRFLRGTSLDELPQLLHVVTGEMSLVGPRPLVPDEDERIPAPSQVRLTMRPGMTGRWQVAGATRIPLLEMVEMDAAYVREWSNFEDLKLLVRTVPHVLRRRGT